MMRDSQYYKIKLTSLILACVAMYWSTPLMARDIQMLGLFKDMVILKVDDVQHKLRTGETSPEGVKLLSANSDEAILEINGVRQSYSLGMHQSARSYQSKKTFSEARIWSNRGMYVTTGLINGLPVNLLVDTGASSVAMSMAHAKQLGINYRYTGKQSSARTASGVVSTWLVKLKSVKVGNIELHNVEGAVVDGQGPSTILLGMSFLKHVKMQREGNLLQLQQRH